MFALRFANITNKKIDWTRMEKSGCCTYSTHFSIVNWVSSSTKRKRGITTFEVLRTTWANKSKSSQMLNFKSCLFLPPSLVKQPRRRRLKERLAIAYSSTKTKTFASLARAFFIVCTFRSCSCPIHDVKWPILQSCGHMTTLHYKFSNFFPLFIPLIGIWSQDS